MAVWWWTGVGCVAGRSLDDRWMGERVVMWCGWVSALVGRWEGCANSMRVRLIGDLSWLCGGWVESERRWVGWVASALVSCGGAHGLVMWWVFGWLLWVRAWVGSVVGG